MKKVMLVAFGAAMLVLAAGCKESAEEEQPAAAQPATEHPAVQPAAEHPAAAQAPKDHPAH